MVRKIEETQAVTLYAPSSEEIHPDHRNLARVAMEAANRCGRVISLALYEVGVAQAANCLLDITAFRQKKQEAMACFASQLEVQNYAQQIAALNVYRTYTLAKDVEAAEAFRVIGIGKANPRQAAMENVDAAQAQTLQRKANGDALVTVIIRSIGRYALLQEALASVARQHYANIEVLVVNAKGEGFEALGDQCGRYPLRLCGSGGPLARSEACNLGLREARGEYLIFLDEDDLLDAGHIAGLVRTLQRHDGIRLAYAGVRVQGQQEGMSGGGYVYNEPYDATRLLCRNYIPIHAALFSRTLVDEGCRFDESLNLSEDWDFWIQLSKRTEFLHLDTISATYRTNNSDSNIWNDHTLAEQAALSVIEKWRTGWTSEQLFAITGKAWDFGRAVAQKLELKEQLQMQSILLLADRDKTVEEKRAAMEKLKEAVTQRNAAMVELDTVILQLEEVAAGQQTALIERDIAVVAKANAMTELNMARSERDSAADECQAAVLASARAQEELLAAEGARDTALRERDAALREKNEAQAQGKAALAERDKAMDERREALAGMETSAAELDELLHSNSWRITAPLRVVRQALLTNLSRALYRGAAASAGILWRGLPMSVETRIEVKGALFRRMPRLFGKTGAYHRWLTVTSAADASPLPAVEPEAAVTLAETDNTAAPWPVPRLESAPPVDTPVRLIAFYLPQFHPIPENDEWWGEGFTEWTNVRPGCAQFAGHYQPHVPGELGYYNLRDVEVMRKQVELAKLYGLGGFCFYFYWFGGKRLLETPILNYLANNELDLPFCLCWANENWSRRWDGLDEDILIGQQHSAQDDLDFIAHIAKYLKDDRYIRVDGKPLVIVYRPSLLPSPRKTVKRWRQWCRENGVGEIYLAYTQSFEAVDPKSYGFDAAAEFPPNNMAPPLITEEVAGKSPAFGGHIFDWRVFPQRSKEYKRPGYKLFRGVNPSWDNTARRKNQATILYGSSPPGYQRWLYNACGDTIDRFDREDERIVFVNAWNEWAEGAHLEPDRRYGYAYLEATRMALLRAAGHQGAAGSDAKAGRKLAVVVHAFYEDVFVEMLGMLGALTVPFKLFVTTPKHLEEAVALRLAESGFEHFLMGVENRGRDVLPFLKILPVVDDEGYEVLLKLHTKKSSHREDGDVWRNDVYSKLLASENVEEIFDILRGDNDVGIVGPEGHLVPMTTYWGSNEDTVLMLAARIGLSREEVMQQPFVAGTMFYARLSALQPLLNLAIRDADFEHEAGQVDGTLAHAIERAISLSAFAVGEKMISTNEVYSQVSVTITDEYRFAAAGK